MTHLLLMLALAAQNATITSNVLSWQDTDTGVTFNILRSTTGCGTANSFAPIATGVTVLTYTDANLNPGTIYSYEVTATRTSDGVVSAPSNCWTMTVAPPKAPNGLFGKSH
jgi:hypothetical protein